MTGTFEESYWRGLDLLVSGNGEDAVAHYREILRGELEPWQRSACHADLSLLHFAMKEPDVAAAELEAAVDLGFDDAQLFDRHRAHPRVRAAIARMRIAAEDAAELQWLRDELKRVSEQTMQLITANMARRDDAPTEVQQSSIPDGPTQSVAVRTRRLMLAQAQKDQLDEVRSSDASRIEYVRLLELSTNGV